MKDKTGDKIFIEKEGKIRLVIEHKIGVVKVLDQLRKRFKVNVFNNKSEDEKIFLIEENL